MLPSMACTSYMTALNYSIKKKLTAESTAPDLFKIKSSAKARYWSDQHPTQLNNGKAVWNIWCDSLSLWFKHNTTEEKLWRCGWIFLEPGKESSISGQRALCHIPNGEKAFVVSALIVCLPAENTKTRHIIQHSEGLYCLTVAYLGKSPKCFGVRAFLSSGDLQQ